MDHVQVTKERHRKRKGYSAQFKLHVVEFAAASSKRAASFKFKVSRANVQRWVKQKENLVQQKTTDLLVWDSFRCHVSEQTKLVLKKLSVDAVVIPGGCTKFIQAPDVNWNAPFKAKIREYYEEWMAAREKRLTKGGNVAAPGMELYLNWVSKAWDALPKELIVKSFKNCGITVATDGSEDHLIHCFKADGPIPSGAERLADARLRSQNDSCNTTDNEGDSVSLGEESEVSCLTVDNEEDNVDNEDET